MKESSQGNDKNAKEKHLRKENMMNDDYTAHVLQVLARSQKN
jgi:hypothetical protein